MYQAPTLMQTLAAIGITVEATEARITILSVNQEWLSAACTQQLLEEHLDEARLRWYGSREAMQADFNRWMMQAEAVWQEVEEQDDDPLDYLIDD